MREMKYRSFRRLTCGAEWDVQGHRNLAEAVQSARCREIEASRGYLGYPYRYLIAQVGDDEGVSWREMLSLEDASD